MLIVWQLIIFLFNFNLHKCQLLRLFIFPTKFILKYTNTSSIPKVDKNVTHSSLLSKSTKMRQFYRSQPWQWVKWENSLIKDVNFQWNATNKRKLGSRTSIAHCAIIKMFTRKKKASRCKHTVEIFIKMSPFHLKTQFTFLVKLQTRSCGTFLCINLTSGRMWYRCNEHA